MGGRGKGRRRPVPPPQLLRKQRSGSFDRWDGSWRRTRSWVKREISVQFIFVLKPASVCFGFEYQSREGLPKPRDGLPFFTPLPFRLAAVAIFSYDLPPTPPPPDFFPVLNSSLAGDERPIFAHTGGFLHLAFLRGTRGLGDAGRLVVVIVTGDNFEAFVVVVWFFDPLLFMFQGFCCFGSCCCCRCFCCGGRAGCVAFALSLAFSACLSFISFRFFFISAGSRSFSAPMASTTVFGSCVGMTAMHVNLPPPVAFASGSSLASSTPMSRALAAAPPLAPTARRSQRRTVPSDEPVTRHTGPPRRGPP